MMKKATICIAASLMSVCIGADAIDRNRVFRLRKQSDGGRVISKMADFESIFDAEGAEFEAMAAFGRALTLSSSISSFPPASSTPPPTTGPKTSITSTSSSPTTSAPTKKTPTSAPTAASSNAPTSSPTTTTPVQDEVPAQITEQTDTADGSDEDAIVETNASGGGVAIPLLSVLGVVGIASLVVARRSYLASAAADTDSASSDSQESDGA